MQRSISIHIKNSLNILFSKLFKVAPEFTQTQSTQHCKLSHYAGGKHLKNNSTPASKSLETQTINNGICWDIAEQKTHPKQSTL